MIGIDHLDNYPTNVWDDGIRSRCKVPEPDKLDPLQSPITPYLGGLR